MSRTQKISGIRGILTALLLATLFASNGLAAPLPQPDPKLAVGGIVRAVLAQADGGTIIGGEFESINGVQRHNLARLTPGGQLDLAWRADVEANPNSNGVIHVLAADDAGNIYVGGWFIQVQGEPRESLARISSAGVLDPLWHPSVSGVVHTLATVQQSNLVYLGGVFDSVDGQPAGSVARVSASGAGVFDTTWATSVSYSVVAMAVALDGSVFIGGQFDTAGGLPRHNLAKLSAETGLADPAWDADPDGSVEALAIDNLGRLHASGDFDQIGGEARYGIARLLADGSADPSFVPFVGNLGSILAMAISESGEFYVAGSFGQTAGQNVYGNLARIGADGNIDAGWQPTTNDQTYAIDVGLNGSIAIGGRFTTINEVLHLGFALVSTEGVPGPAIDAELPGEVNAIVVQPNGGTIVGGTFMKGGGMERANLLRIMPSGEVDPVWNPSANDSVWALATDGNDSVYAAGRFSRIGGVQRARLARVDADSEGELDPTYAVSPGGYVYAIAVDGTGDVYLGGAFPGFPGIQQSYLAKSSRSGTIDTSWNPPRDKYVTDFAETVDGQLDVLYFSPGFPVDTGEIRRVSKVEGVVARSWTLDRAADGIERSGGTLYVHGYFNQLDGVDVPHLARILPDGAVDPSWNLHFDGYATNMAIDSDNGIYLGGDMYIDGILYKVLKLSAVDAQVDFSWSHLVEGFVHCLAVGQEGHLLVGGDFNAVDNEPRAGFAALGSSDAIFSNGFESPPGKP